MSTFYCQPYIIILGHLMDENGVLDNETSARVALAFQIDDELVSSAVILCGWDYRADSDITIAEAMRCHVESSRPDLMDKLLIQPLSRDTVGDAFFSRLLLQYICNASEPYIVVVTSNYHVKRTASIFEFIFNGYASRIHVQGCEVVGGNSSRQLSEAQSTAAFLKTFSGIDPGDMNAIHRAMAVGHPFYNGSVYPLISSIEPAVNKLRQSHLKA